MKMPFDLMKNYTLPKRSDEVWIIGGGKATLIFWDNDKKWCTVSDGGEKRVGMMTVCINALICVAAAPADNGSEVGLVRLNGTEFE
jgi:hypothetical protein